MPGVFKLLNLLIFILLLPSLYSIQSELNSARYPSEKLPTVFIALLVRNKAHILPWFLKHLDELEYPKDRILIWIASDHNEDSSMDMLLRWIQHTGSLYHKIVPVLDHSSQVYPDAIGPFDWSRQRFDHVINLKQRALDTARAMWADYLFYLDADAILLNPQTLKSLIAEDHTVVAPLLNCTASEWYANFWGGVSEEGFYARTPEYSPIIQRHWLGSFHVGNVHSAVLINLQHFDSDTLHFQLPYPGYSGPKDDVVIFGQWAAHYGVPLYLLNKDFYGFIPHPMESQNTLEQDQEQFVHVKVESLIYREPLHQLPYISVPEVPKDKLGMDQIYMINLARRPDRRLKMLHAFDELGIEVEIIDAVDGKSLNDSYLHSLGIKMLEGFADPYHGRVLTKGEIGCFLSHYFIWQDMLAHEYQNIIVFEDDLYFVPYFRTKLDNVMRELGDTNLQWDLIYLGRKRLNHPDESWFSEELVWPDYSYWTLSYVLSRSGAEKLVQQKPLGKLVPVDEYLPIMFDKHPTDEWKEAFEPRNLVALSAQPLLIYPTHYTGEPGYITDTENSEVVKFTDGNDFDKRPSNNDNSDEWRSDGKQEL